MSQAFTLIHHSLSDSPRMTCSPASSIPSTGVPFLMFFFFFYHTLTVLFLFRYMNTYHCTVIAYSIQYCNVQYKNNKLYYVAQGYSRLDHLDSVSALYYCTMMKSFNDTFPRMQSTVKQHMMYIYVYIYLYISKTQKVGGWEISSRRRDAYT